MNNDLQLPVGNAMLGRVINIQGEPLDNKGPITGTHSVPISTLTKATIQQDTTYTQLETGIKPVDLLAPLPYGGVIGLFAAAGIGMLALLEEILYSLINHHQGYVVCLSIDENSYTVSPLTEMLKESNLESKAVMLFEQKVTGQDAGLRMLQAGLTHATWLREQGHEVMLLVNWQLVRLCNLLAHNELKATARAKAITTVLLVDKTDSEAVPAHTLTGQLVLNRALANQGLWPAVDYQLSTTCLLASNAVSSEHKHTAEQVRQLFLRYTDLQHRPELTSEEQQISKRARRIQLFLTHPFFVAESFTGIPGEYVSTQETLKGCQALLDGRYDDIPEQVFRYVGTLDDALAKSKHLA